MLQCSLGHDFASINTFSLLAGTSLLQPAEWHCLSYETVRVKNVQRYCACVKGITKGCSRNAPSIAISNMHTNRLHSSQSSSWKDI
jgi:hypothetical protein